MGMSLSSKTKVTAASSKKPHLFTFSQLFRIDGRNDKFCYSDNSRCMPYRRPVNENIEKICSKRMFTCFYVMEPNRYHVLKRNHYLAGSRALPWRHRSWYWNSTQHCFPILDSNVLELEEFYWMSAIWYIMSTVKSLKLSKKICLP